MQATTTSPRKDVAYSNRCGAAGARGAHNPEVRCSNHLAGIYTFSSFTEAARRRTLIMSKQSGG